MAKQHYLMINIYLFNCRKRFARTSLLLLFLLCSTIVSAQQVVVTLQEAGTLSTAVGDNKLSITNLKVSGSINDADMTTLYDMAKNGNLSVLDLSEATTTSGDVIGKNAFASCSNLTSISLPQNVTSIGNYAFYSCKGLESITIPNYVESIGDGAFCKCSSLTSVTIGSSVTSIGMYAFQECSSLKDITIPSSVTNIGINVFDGCSSLTSIEVGDENTNYHTDSNCLIGTTSNKLIRACNLANITIPNSVTSIDNYAFSSCSKLTSVTIPSSVTNIGMSAFLNCSSLAEVVLLGDNLPECSSYTFRGISSSATLYCKSSLVESCTETPWKNFKSVKPLPSIEIPEAGYATGCFDLDLDFTLLGDDVAAYIASAFSPTESTVLLTRAKKIPAKTGFIVKGTAGKEYTIPATTTDYVYSNMLVGVLENTKVQKTEGSYTNYVLGKDADGAAGFFLADENGTDVPANKAYLRIPTNAVSTSGESSEAKTSLGLSFDDEDGTTGISEIREQSNRTSGETVIYNLNGQRKQSLTKGLNIVNGKKIFVK